MTETDRPIANPIVVLREEFDDWAVLFHPDTADAVGINPVGVAIWKRMDGKRSLGEIVSEIRNSFEGVPGVAFDEIAAFIAKLSESGFVGYELKNSR
ncbi:MAG: SynChlorMet cassette protein ScmD [bacterium]|jgi:SynChlorMet cassette protein ScmD